MGVIYLQLVWFSGNLLSTEQGLIPWTKHIKETKLEHLKGKDGKQITAQTSNCGWLHMFQVAICMHQRDKPGFQNKRTQEITWISCGYSCLFVFSCYGTLGKPAKVNPKQPRGKNTISAVCLHNWPSSTLYVLLLQTRFYLTQSLLMF